MILSGLVLLSVMQLGSGISFMSLLLGFQDTTHNINLFRLFVSILDARDHLVWTEDSMDLVDMQFWWIT